MLATCDINIVQNSEFRLTKPFGICGREQDV